MPGADRVTAYARGVLRKRPLWPASQYVKWACARHLADLKRTDIYFDAEKAEVACNFFTLLPHVKGRQWSGQPFTLEPWQCFIVGSAFGWLRPDGLRRYRYVYVEIPRKNGKSTLGAGVGLYLLLMDGEQGGEVYAAATKKDQAKIVHGVAWQMAQKSEHLRAHTKLFVNNINHPTTLSKFEPLGADSDTLDGLNPSGLILDELHAWKGRGLWDVLEDSLGSRALGGHPLVWVITTAGYDEHGICYEQRGYVLRALDPNSDLKADNYFGYVATLDEGDDWRDPKTWAKANPNLGVSKSLEYMADLATKAQEMPRKENSFLNKHLDVWTQAAVKWLSLDRWDALAKPFDESTLAGEPCFVGVDLSSKFDLTAAVLVFPYLEQFFCICRFYVPLESIDERAERDRVPYPQWVREGFITATPGGAVDYDKIRADINELAETYQIKEVAVDPWNAQQMMSQLDGDGFTVVPFRQGWASMSEPCKELEKIMRTGQLRHGGNPVLRWCAGNVTVAEDAAENLKPDKDKSADRIDGVVALVMGLGRAIVNKAGDAPYLTHGIRTI